MLNAQPSPVRTQRAEVATELEEESLIREDPAAVEYCVTVAVLAESWPTM